MDKPKAPPEWIHAPRPIPPYLASFDLFPDKSIFEYKGEPLKRTDFSVLFKNDDSTQDEEKE